MTIKALVVDDDSALCEMIKAGLDRRGFSVSFVTSAEDALRAIELSDFDVVLSDIRMPGVSGTELCERIAANRPDVPVVVMTAFGSMDTAIGAIRSGAYDFINKPLDMEELAFSLRRAGHHRELREEVKRLRRAAGDSVAIGGMIGDSQAMGAVTDMIERVADSGATVLISGETGTGKEVAARAIHNRSRRQDGPFVAVNCAAFPEPLLEAVLFGHVRGAFTDAREDRVGLFLEADHGTLLLDEVAELPLALQPKLLRALQERSVRPIGAAREVAFDVRIIAVTNRDLETAVDERRFREDLFYRLNVVQITLPPLRSRGGDALLLAQHFLDQFASKTGKPIRGIAPAAAQHILAYEWPGNVRELQNCIERAVALARFDQIGVDDLPDKIRSYKSAHLIVAGNDPSELPPMEEVERRYILRVLKSAGGNRSLTAKILKLDRKTLYRKLQRYGIDDDRS